MWKKKILGTLDSITSSHVQLHIQHISLFICYRNIKRMFFYEEEEKMVLLWKKYNYFIYIFSIGIALGI